MSKEAMWAGGRRAPRFDTTENKRDDSRTRAGEDEIQMRLAQDDTKATGRRRAPSRLEGEKKAGFLPRGSWDGSRTVAMWLSI